MLSGEVEKIKSDYDSLHSDTPSTMLVDIPVLEDKFSSPECRIIYLSLQMQLLQYKPQSENSVCSEEKTGLSYLSF